MSRQITIAVIQSAFSDEMDDNIARIEAHVRQAAGQGADVILPPELFCGHYFCTEQSEANFARALPMESHPAVTAMRALAKELDVVIPVSVYERAGPELYNSIAMVDAGGAVLGTYRKAHIPDGPGYMEKFYFRPGDTGFKVWETAKGRIGVGICWDQWYPEAARAMALMGAEVLLYPTAIGSEPHDPGLDTRDRWQRAMIGHAVCNVIPVAAANRTGVEGAQTYYGSSFIAGPDGAKLSELDRTEQGVAMASFDLARIETERAAWGFFRDRRSEQYGRLVGGHIPT